MITGTSYGFVILDSLFGIASVVCIINGVDYISYSYNAKKPRSIIAGKVAAPAIGAGKRALNVISGRHNIARKAFIKTRLAIDRLC